jgi:hypothetical protein
MGSLRIGGFEMRGTARTYSKPRTDADPLCVDFLLSFGEIDDGLGTAQGVLSQFDRTPAGEATIVTKGNERELICSTPGQFAETALCFYVGASCSTTESTSTIELSSPTIRLVRHGHLIQIDQ